MGCVSGISDRSVVYRGRERFLQNRGGGGGISGAGLQVARAQKLAILERVKSSVVTSSPDVMGGTPVFAGTRVPIENLLDYLEGGESIEDFLEGFPSVSREQVIAFLEETKFS